MDGGGGTTTTVQQSDPWDQQRPYLTYGFGEAQRQYQNLNPTFFPQSTVAAQSPETQAGIAAQAARGMAGSPLNTAAQGLAGRTLGGEFLTAGNPNSDMVFQNIMSKVAPAVNSQFSAAGRYGSGAHADTVTRALTEAYAPTAAGLYENERGRMQDTMFGAPSLAAADYQDIGAVRDAGAARDQYGQAQINDLIARHNFAQQQPYDQLSQYMNMIQGNYGGTTTGQTPYYNPSPLSQIAGLAAGLGGLGMMFGGF